MAEDLPASDSEITKYVYELGQLKRVQRSGWWLAGVPVPESVAEHSFRTAAIAWLLAHMEGADPARALLMGLFHDAHEARITDLHRVAARYVARRESGPDPIAAQLSRLPADAAQELKSALTDLKVAGTLEARVVHDADLLECLFQAREYEAQGNTAVADWIQSCRAELTTESARRLADEAIEMPPSSWWHGLKASRNVSKGEADTPHPADAP
jgi:putative hydrolase of HD superfamily